MHNEHWSEGQSWSCLPHAVACFALTFWIQANVGVAWAAAPLALGLAFMACESGFVWDAEARRGRSYTGWIVGGKLVAWVNGGPYPPLRPCNWNAPGNR